MPSADIRQSLVQALELDLAGPRNRSSLEEEVLPQAPSRWYLTGFLVPMEAGESQRAEETSEEEVDELSDAGGSDDAIRPEPATSRRAFLPSSLGLSILLSSGAQALSVVVRWGDYRRIPGEETGNGPPGGVIKGSAGPVPRNSDRWKRTGRGEDLAVKVPSDTSRPMEIEVPGSEGLKLVLSVRTVPE